MDLYKYIYEYVCLGEGKGKQGALVLGAAHGFWALQGGKKVMRTRVRTSLNH